jgi:hypothetical protein
MGTLNLPHEFFVRPTGDFKQFTGEVIKRQDFFDWRDRILTLDSECDLNRDTSIIISPVQQIQEEYRFFIVAGQTIAGACYKKDGFLVKNMRPTQASVEFVFDTLDIWQPHKAFVIDIALLPNGEHKIIEYNCINASGFYSCDMKQVLSAIDTLEAGDEKIIDDLIAGTT